MVVSLGQEYNIGEKLIVMLYTYINHHAGAPDKTKQNHCSCFLPIYSGHQVRWTYQPGSHRRKVTQDFSCTFLLRCAPLFLSRGRIQPFLPLVDREVEFCVLTIQSFSTCWVLFFLFFFSEKKSHLPGFELTSQRARRLRGYF